MQAVQEMIIKRILRSRNLQTDLTVMVLAVVMSASLLLRPKLYESSDVYGNAYGLPVAGVVVQTFFLVCAFLVFNRLRDKGGPAAAVLLLFYLLEDNLRTVPVVSYLNDVYLGFGFWALIILAPFGVLQRLITSKVKDGKTEADQSSDDELVSLNLAQRSSGE